MSELLAPLIVVAILSLLVAGVGGLVRLWVRCDPVMHDLYCTCNLCRSVEIKRQVQRREWLKQNREIEQAVEEMLRETRR